ncbi:glycosyltransferase family 2 protein [Cylindrospermopsis raciborskii]|uniref:glycosyltransferase family 2 protein n=1 Tax=Cylindrospermopsis raciborskii TaxID=77022 RepID=UPI001BAD6057|nr:glycosyltransferase family 2 protein [Cylindrospermopsis raciborskii]
MLETNPQYLQPDSDSKDYPLVSVIINCYNGERYLREAIESVMKQTYKNWEIIYWDNRSTDSSLKIANSINCDKIKCHLASEHTNLNSARNLAIKECSGQFIAFLDADDIWENNKLELQIPLFEDPDVAFVFSNFYVFYEYFHMPKIHLGCKRQLPTGYILEDLFEWFTVGLLTLVVRKEFIKELDYPFDCRYDVIGDIVLTRQLSCKYKAASSNLPLAYWRRHRSSMLHTENFKYYEEIEDWLSTLPSDSPFFSNSKILKSIGLTKQIININRQLEKSKLINAATLIKRLPWKKQVTYWIKLLLSLILQK